MSSAPFALIGIALSIFLGFRNNACYDRWWEARRQWGTLVIACRNFGRQTLLLEERGGSEGAQLRIEMVRLVIAFTYALVQHLRPSKSQPAVPSGLATSMSERFLTSRNPPDYLLRQITSLLVGARTRGLLSDIEFSLIEGTVGQMETVLGSCERIRSTPCAVRLHAAAPPHGLCLLLPAALRLCRPDRWLEPIAAGMVAYTFFGLDMLGDELEEPFGDCPTTCPSRRSPRPSPSTCARRWARQTCRPSPSRSITC